MTTEPKPLSPDELQELHRVRDVVRNNTEYVIHQLFAYMIDSLQRQAAQMPAGSSPTDFAKLLLPVDSPQTVVWHRLFDAAVRALKRPHFDLSLERKRAAYDLFVYGNEQERDNGAVGLYSWWIDDAPALYRSIEPEAEATRAVLTELGLPTDTILGFPARVTALTSNSLVRSELEEISTALRYTTRELRDVEARLRDAMVELDATRAERDALRVQLDTTRAELNGARLQRDFATDELERVKQEQKPSATPDDVGQEHPTD